MAVSDIIEALGGRDRVADLTGAKVNAVRAWTRIGIPYRFMRVLRAEAERLGRSEITIEAMQDTKPNASGQAA